MIRFRIKLLGFLFVLFACVNGNAQEPIVWHVDRDSALMHFPMRDSVFLEIEAYSDRMDAELKTRWAEINELFVMNDDESKEYYGARFDEIFEKRLELEIRKQEMEDSLHQKTKELDNNMLTSFQLQFEAIRKQHPEKTIVFEPMNTDSPDWFNLTAKFILFLEENRIKK